MRASLGPADHPAAVLRLAALPAIYHLRPSSFPLPPLRMDAGLSDLTSYVHCACPIIAEALHRRRVQDAPVLQQLAALAGIAAARHAALRRLRWHRIAELIPDISAPAALLLAELDRAHPNVARDLWPHPDQDGKEDRRRS